MPDKDQVELSKRLHELGVRVGKFEWALWQSSRTALETVRVLNFITPSNEVKIYDGSTSYIVRKKDLIPILDFEDAVRELEKRETILDIHFGWKDEHTHYCLVELATSVKDPEGYGNTRTNALLSALIKVVEGEG